MVMNLLPGSFFFLSCVDIKNEKKIHDSNKKIFLWIMVFSRLENVEKVQRIDSVLSVSKKKQFNINLKTI